MDVAAWLGGLGLERYEQAFRESAVDWEVLPELNECDLKELGLPLGPRKKLLKAIAELPGRPTAPSAGTAPSPRAVSPEAERRQLTVMFVSLVDCTALSAKLDPEDLREVIRAYRSTVAGAMALFEGHVAKFMGDGVLAYFGYPKAHEDEAERAIRTGLALVEAIGKLDAPSGGTLSVRVGIATGLVIVGDLIGEGGAQEEAVVGETPNLAARLQAYAAPGCVVISQATRRLVGELFELADIGPQQLKGFAGPMKAWRVEGESRTEGRFEALHGHGLTPLVGRERELGILLDRLERAREGEGQVVLLVGDAGIGKSRIARALRDDPAIQTCMPLSHYCSPYHTNSALYPVVGLLERAAGLERADPPAVKLAKLEALLTLGSERLDEVVPLVAALLAIPIGEKYPRLNLTPQRHKERTLEVLVDQVAGLATKQPVFAIYEDVHWIDPTTLEALGLLIERVQNLPVLVLITYRPEFSPPWSSHRHVMQLSLTPLTRSHGAAMVERIAGDKALPPEVLDQILARTDGVPLFVEELTKTVLESGLLTDAGDRYELDGPLPPLAIPATLYDSLMARLDRLVPVKKVAQTAAVIGREFSHELLAAVSSLPESDLNAALDQLVTSELISRRGTSPPATYRFKHALVQDAAYQSLLKPRRQQLHTKIGHVLEERFSDVAATKPEILAHHWRGAEEINKAAHYLRDAATLAVEQSSHREAGAHLAMALELVQAQPPSVGRQQTETALRLSLGAALIPPKGYAADEVREAFERASELSHQTGDREQLFLALRGLWNCHLLRTELRKASGLAEQIFELARQSGTAERMLVAYRVMATSLFQLGRIEEARRLFDAGLALWDPALSAHYAVAYGEDPGLFCCVYAAWCDDCVGFRDEALVKMHRALDHARGQPNRYGLAVALGYASLLHCFRREPELVESLAQEGIELCREQSIVQWLAHCRVLRGWALAVEGDHADGLGELREGIAAWQDIKMQLMLPCFCTLLGQAHAAAGQIDAALKALEQADVLVARTGHEAFEAMRQHQRGELLLRASAVGRGQSERQFVRGLELAHAQGCRTIQLRAATSLARLWAGQGERQKARELLAPFYGWFTEGFDTADLKDARALLDELG